MRLPALLLILCLLSMPATAVEPHEMLADPALEARAQALDDLLRCVKCRSESIASSNADWAADARVLVRELIEAGKSDEEVLVFFVDRYGDYVLMKPRLGGSNAALWLAGPVLLLLGAGIAVGYLRRRSAPGAAKGLSVEERERLAELMRD